MTTRIQHTARRYGHLMRVCRALAHFNPERAAHYLNLRSCLWARLTRELRRNVMRH